MDVLSEQEMAAKLDFASPLKPEPEQRESLWCIPFEYGDSRKGTRISIALAKTIAAQLLMHVAQAEQRELRRYFDREKERGDSLGRQLSESHGREQQQAATIAQLQKQLKRRKKR
jgi:hypothetical protein